MHPDEQSLVYDLITTTEEALEMTGIILLIYALMSLIQRSYGGLSIDVPPLEDH